MRWAWEPLGALAWYSLLDAVEGCRNIVLDLEAPPPPFTHSTLTGGKCLPLVVFGLTSRHWELNDVALGVEECLLDHHIP